MTDHNLPELLRDMATELVYSNKAKNGPPPVEESIPWQAADAIERLTAQLAQAREVLEPFGDVAGEGVDDYPDTFKAVVVIGRHTHYALKLGNFRRVSDFLQSQEPTDG